MELCLKQANCLKEYRLNAGASLLLLEAIMVYYSLTWQDLCDAVLPPRI